LSSAERKSIINVLVLYLTSTILLVSILAYSYYNYETEQIEIQEKRVMIEDAKEVFTKIQTLHNNQFLQLIYPRFKEFNSAIYDIDKYLIYSTINDTKIDFSKSIYSKDGYKYFIYEVKPYYLGSAYIVIERKNESLLTQLGIKIIMLSVFIIFIIIITSIFLVRLILKPIRDNLNLLDRFIKDTTHELNTPISTILTNIELIDSANLDLKVEKKFNRIKTASLTISNIYEDLVFLVLNHSVSSQNVDVDINTIVKQRVDYFNILFESKNIKVSIIENDNFILNIDNKKITRVIDNLISNAIKYTKKSTNINIIIEKNNFKICDQGDGMTAMQISKIFERYTRFDDTQGGFGIGYNIVYTIVKEYNLNIDINSIIDEGTCVTISQ